MLNFAVFLPDELKTAKINNKFSLNPKLHKFGAAKLKCFTVDLLVSINGCDYSMPKLHDNTALNYNANRIATKVH